jgi:hypothetical protein
MIKFINSFNHFGREKGGRIHLPSGGIARAPHPGEGIYPSREIWKERG